MDTELEYPLVPPASDILSELQRLHECVLAYTDLIDHLLREIARKPEAKEITSQGDAASLPSWSIPTSYLETLGLSVKGFLRKAITQASPICDVGSLRTSMESGTDGPANQLLALCAEIDGLVLGMDVGEGVVPLSDFVLCTQQRKEGHSSEDDLLCRLDHVTGFTTRNSIHHALVLLPLFAETILDIHKAHQNLLGSDSFLFDQIRCAASFSLLGHSSEEKRKGAPDRLCLYRWAAEERIELARARIAQSDSMRGSDVGTAAHGYSSPSGQSEGIQNSGRLGGTTASDPTDAAPSASTRRGRRKLSEEVLERRRQICKACEALPTAERDDCASRMGDERDYETIRRYVDRKDKEEQGRKASRRQPEP